MEIELGTFSSQSFHWTQVRQWLSVSTWARSYRAARLSPDKRRKHSFKVSDVCVDSRSTYGRVTSYRCRIRDTSCLRCRLSRRARKITNVQIHIKKTHYIQRVQITHKESADVSFKWKLNERYYFLTRYHISSLFNRFFDYAQEKSVICECNLPK